MNFYEVMNNTKYSIDIKKINNFIKYSLNYLNIKNVVFNIVIIDNKEMKIINKKYRDIDLPTDVISFAFEDAKDNIKLKKRLLGEIYISYEKVVSQSKENNVTEFQELIFLIIHGILHLLGYNHDTKGRENKMFKLQEEVIIKYEV